MVPLARWVYTLDTVCVRVSQHAFLAERRRARAGQVGRAVVARLAHPGAPFFVTTGASRELWVERFLLGEDASWHVGAGGKLLPVGIVEESIHFFGIPLLFCPTSLLFRPTSAFGGSAASFGTLATHVYETEKKVILSATGKIR